jgi:hypothetical protein
MRMTDRSSSPTCTSSSRTGSRAHFALVLMTITMAGCAPYTLVEPKRTAIGDMYTVEPQTQWSAAEAGKILRWTVDGFPLEMVTFVRGLDEGEPLYPRSGGQPDRKPPTYRARMTPSEIMELVVDSLSLQGVQQVAGTNLRPRKFGDVDGFAFDVTYLLGNGLEGQGIVVGAVAKNRLHLIMYTGTRRHYFPKYRADVERMVDSIRMR